MYKLYYCPASRDLGRGYIFAIYCDERTTGSARNTPQLRYCRQAAKLIAVKHAVAREFLAFNKASTAADTSAEVQPSVFRPSLLISRRGRFSIDGKKPARPASGPGDRQSCLRRYTDQHGRYASRLGQRIVHVCMPHGEIVMDGASGEKDVIECPRHLRRAPYSRR
jgi:hypothetical protein